ncbi:MAG TPA: alcohol dehydrogenase catalytic domain-containing protein [Alphaproteobacteria bacterium]|jgi:threonine dehydrogenase-like Zn-dependent dehydrogenase|nr:alcohol dehydrogenase catalytic domain-containing protein [Alphaproteobacteria bacterium]
MKAVNYSGGKVIVVDVPPPTGPGVRVKITSVGICGSDLAMLDSGFDIAGIPGHEMAGVLADGTPVAIEPIIPCGTCEFCLAGDYQVCRSGVERIFGVGRNGGMAEELIVPERCLVRLPRRLDSATAALVEPLAVSIHGLRRAKAKRGDRVVVIGGGTIGLCAVAAAVAIGCKVDLAARHDHQKEAGARLGAGEPRGEYDIAVDSAGSASGARDACEWLRSNGKLLLLSAAWDDVQLPGLVLASKEPEIVCSTMYSQDGVTRDIDNAAYLLGMNPLIGKMIVTHRFPLEAAADAFAMARDRKAGVIKVLLEP